MRIGWLRFHIARATAAGRHMAAAVSSLLASGATASSGDLGEEISAPMLMLETAPLMPMLWIPVPQPLDQPAARPPAPLPSLQPHVQPPRSPALHAIGFARRSSARQACSTARRQRRRTVQP